jgi:hypothetical protein
LSPLHPNQILKVLEITDSFNVHREAVFIPLLTEETGSVIILADGRLQITCPSAGSFDGWLDALRAQLGKMDLSKLTKHSISA